MTAETIACPDLTGAGFLAAVQAAVRAPSLHNTQPWRFRHRAGGMDVLADPSRRLPVADPRGWALRVACGAAVFNARMALAARGTPVRVHLRPDPSEPDLLARLVPLPPAPATPWQVALNTAIPRRFSNRRPFVARPVPADARARLMRAGRKEGAWLALLVGASPLAALSEVVKAADSMLNRIPEYRAEIAAWTRPDDSYADGVPARAGDPRPEPHDLLAVRDFGGAPRAPGRDFETDPLVAVLGTVGDTPSDQLTAGQVLQRVLLTCTDAGLSTSMLSQPIEVAPVREMLRIALGRSGTPQMVIRIGYGEPGSPTPRRPPSEAVEP